MWCENGINVQLGIHGWEGNWELEIKRLKHTHNNNNSQSDVISWFNDLFDELQCYKVKTSFFLDFMIFDIANGDVAVLPLRFRLTTFRYTGVYTLQIHQSEWEGDRERASE